VEYLIQWTGYSPKDNTWETPDALAAFCNLVHNFHNTYPQKPCGAFVPPPIVQFSVTADTLAGLRHNPFKCYFLSFTTFYSTHPLLSTHTHCCLCLLTPCPLLCLLAIYITPKQKKKETNSIYIYLAVLLSMPLPTLFLPSHLKDGPACPAARGARDPPTLAPVLTTSSTCTSGNHFGTTN
jgi:hypothetical protein